MGHKVTTEGVHTDNEKIVAVKEWPRPKNLKELRSFWVYAHIIDVSYMGLPTSRVACIN